MTRTLTNMAKYNKIINKRLKQDLDKYGNEFCQKDRSSKYGSINGILYHDACALVFMLKYINKNFNLDYQINVESIDEDDYNQVFKLLEEINDVYIKILTELAPADLDKKFDLCPFNLNIDAKFYFQHILNNSTHHRGAIQYILEENGFDDDFSSVLENFSAEAYK